MELLQWTKSMLTELESLQPMISLTLKETQNGLDYCQKFSAAAFSRFQGNMARLQTAASPDPANSANFVSVLGEHWIRCRWNQRGVAWRNERHFSVGVGNYRRSSRVDRGRSWSLHLCAETPSCHNRSQQLPGFVRSQTVISK